MPELLVSRPADTGLPPDPVAGDPNPFWLVWQRFAQRRLALLSVLILVGVLAAAWIGPLLYTHEPNAITGAQFQPPSKDHWFGTDVHGRDLLARIMVGARISILVGIFGATVSLLIGVTWGAAAGYAGGRVEGAMMRVVDILYSLPSILFVIVLITALEGLFREWSLFQSGGSAGWARLLFLFAGLGSVSWLTMARIVRGQVLTLRALPFVEAARSLGLSHRRILIRHIFPNLIGIVGAYTMLTIPSIILYESFLSYLGLGIQPPMASWGSLIAEGSAYLNPIRVYWWLILFPTGTLAITLLALNFAGDALRDAIDPRER